MGTNIGHDFIVSAVTKSGLFRAMAAKTTNLCEEARVRHGLSHTCTAVLGRVLTAAALVARTLDEGQSVTLRFIGDGPAGGAIGEGVHEGGQIAVRGYVANPRCELPLTQNEKLDVGGAVGSNGYLYVTKDLGLKEMYTGSAKLQSGEIGIDLAYYFVVSEQTPTAVSLGVRVQGEGAVSGAGGILVQALPGREDELPSLVDAVQHNLEDLGSVSMLIQEGSEPRTLLERVFYGVDEITMLEEIPVVFKCRCNRERALTSLVSLGAEDLRKMALERDKTEVRCSFCGEVYVFRADEINDLANSIRSSTKDT